MELFQWCTEDWQLLRTAIRERGLEQLVPIGGARGAQALKDELTGKPDAQGFDPLLRAWGMLNSRALEMGSDPTMCPLCWLRTSRKRHQTVNPGCQCEWSSDTSDPKAWLEGCVDSIREHALELKLLRLS